MGWDTWSITCGCRQSDRKLISRGEGGREEGEWYSGEITGCRVRGQEIRKTETLFRKRCFFAAKTSNGKEKTFASVAVETNRSVVAENEYDCKAGKYFSGGDESNIGESGRGTSCVRKRVS